MQMGWNWTKQAKRGKQNQDHVDDEANCIHATFKMKQICFLVTLLLEFLVLFWFFLVYETFDPWLVYTNIVIPPFNLFVRHAAVALLVTF